jgi:hypothetical protein
LIDPRTRPVITADHQDPDFFAAILKEDDGAMPELDADELAAWREYVLDGGSASAKPDPKPNVIVRSRSYEDL